MIVNGWAEEIKALKKEMDGMRSVYGEQFSVMQKVLLSSRAEKESK